MCEGASKQSPDLKNYTAPGPRLRFLNSWIRHWSKSPREKEGGGVLDLTCGLIFRTYEDIRKIKA